MTGLFIPAWAKDELERKKPAPFDQAELETLRAFYKAWETLHAVPKDKHHKRQAEDAAKALVEQAHILRRMYVDPAQ